MLKRKFRSVYGAVPLVAAIVTMAPAAYAWTYQADGQWAQFNFGNWTVYQNEWGSSAPCTLYANNANNWASAGSWTGGGTKGYPHAQSTVLNYDIYSYWFVSGFNVSPPSGALYTYMYDMWTANQQDELIVVEHSNNSGNWGTQIASNQTIGGRFYSSVWQASNGSNNVLIFSPGSMRDSGNEDCNAYFKWASQNGKLHNNTLREVSFGVEPTATNGWQQFTTNSFWGSYGHN
ncbi:hypothetical protein CCAX7_62820 [Capsulimonas corticalis]|uniref:Uncharacterized protein n=1 Tax=Capsulimonas corticalis TaxID=2219043 RepID=A0A402CWP2_9BACT|nr:hypothetical protein [Capsulimonas corticalis]BDI34231.1 hypothetical protein CCAX7_62820 [Capsulimonas corticalis]